MKKPAEPRDEPDRIASLRSLDVLDTLPEERFDRFTRLAKRLFEVPIALVSLVDSERQWFKSRQGLEATETPREISFCGHAILQADQILHVPDAASDQRFFDNPLVKADPRIRFYAGCPIKAPNGSPVGTLCLIDRDPRVLSDEDLELLRDLAEMVETEFTALRIATIDELTGISNRRGFLAAGRHVLALCKRLERSATLLFFDLDGFKEINDQHGHAAGDRALATMAQIFLDVFRESDLVARFGGDEFCVLCTGLDFGDSDRLLARLSATVEAREMTESEPYRLAYSVGAVAYDAERHSSIEDLMADADKLMYEQKKGKRTTLDFSRGAS